MELDSSKNILGYEKIPKLLRKFAIPSIVAMLVSSLYNIVDQIFIGQGVGFEGNAATNVAFPLTTISLAISLLISIGSSVIYSISLGAGRQKEAEKIVGNSIIMMFASSILYALTILLFATPMLKAFGATDGLVLEYSVNYSKITAIGMPFLIFTNGISNLSRADGDPKFSMTSMLIGAAVNTILDPIFIFIFKWGIAGAAWATIIGQFFSFLYSFTYLRKFKHIKLKKESYKLDFSLWLKTASLGMSNSLNQIAITFVQVVLNNSLTYYGALSPYGSDIPLAGCGIVMKVNSILVAFFIGLSQASNPIVGFNYGAKKYDRCKATYKLAVLVAVTIALIGEIFFQFTPEAIVSIFGKGDASYIEFSVLFMKTFLIMVAGVGIQMLSSNFFSSIGKPVKGVFLSLTRQFLVFIPLIIILPRFYGLKGILYAAPIADTTSMLISLTLIFFEFRKLSQPKIDTK